ncbi:MAG TPA: formate dehydrogenase accessory sulfurtransferase FdhD [Steroidobacteraceae bacterium]|nr:formate dehydrogenase accessory sulfurtransferase FdhD [Steroidobacteraceae bacterium]
MDLRRRGSSYRVRAEAAIETVSIEAFEVQPEARLMRPVAGAPRLTASSSDSMRAISIVDELGIDRTIYIPAERSLSVVLDDRELVTLMTLGASPELLVLGFLFNQRLIDAAADVESIAVDWRSGCAVVATRAAANGRQLPPPRAVASGCGQGSIFMHLQAHIDAIRLPAAGEARIRQSALRSILEVMRQHDSIHRHARSVHSCALFQDARLLVSVEDVSRHNALDTISGWMIQHGISGADKVLFTTGRLTGEMIIKAAQSGVPIVVSRNGISSMGYDLAKKFGMALFGRALNRRYHCYVGADRLDADETPAKN